MPADLPTSADKTHLRALCCNDDCFSIGSIASDQGSGRLGVLKALRNVDRRRHRPARSRGRIVGIGEPDLVVAGKGQDLAVEGDKLLAQLLTRIQQRLDHRRQIGHVFDEFADACYELDGADKTDLEAEVAQQPANVVLNGNGLFLQELARRQ